MASKMGCLIFNCPKDHKTFVTSEGFRELICGRISSARLLKRLCRLLFPYKIHIYDHICII